MTERTQTQMDRYIDPNSGAAPQPGGQVAGAIQPATDEEAEQLEQLQEEQAEKNTTEPDEAADPNRQPEEPTEVSQEQLTGAQQDAALEHEASDLGLGTTETGGEPTQHDETGEEQVHEGAGVESEGIEVPADGTEAELNGDSTEEGAGQSEEVTRPSNGASKAEWVTYAKTKGATDEQLEDMKRDEIRDAYGS